MTEALNRQRRRWDVFIPTMAAAFRLIPYALRFRAILTLARWWTPVFRRTALYRSRFWSLTGPREEALRMVVRALQRAGVEFPIEIRVETDEPLADLTRGPAIYVSGHFPQHPLLVRWLIEQGARLTSIRNSLEQPHVIGTSRPLDLLLGTSPSLFVAIRRRLRQNGVVTLDIDAGGAGKRTVPVEVGEATWHISSAAFEFAAATATPVFFFSTRVDECGNVVGHIVRAPSGSVEAVMAAFIAYYRGFVESIRR